MENVGIFYAHLEYVMYTWYILWSFGKFAIIWYISPRFGILRREKSGNPAAEKCTRESENPNDVQMAKQSFFS
jgi:hypothetical protein